MGIWIELELECCHVQVIFCSFEMNLRLVVVEIVTYICQYIVWISVDAFWCFNFKIDSILVYFVEFNVNCTTRSEESDQIYKTSSLTLS